jgi:hypothetical protein
MAAYPSQINGNNLVRREHDRSLRGKKEGISERPE